MSKSWRQPPPEGRLPKKPQWEPTLKGELYSMNADRYLVVSAWAPKDSDYELTENVALHRTSHGAWRTLEALAEGQNYDLQPTESSFTADGDDHTDYYVWYIETITEGP